MNAEQMEEIKRHFGVVAESLRSDIRQIAEGHATIRPTIKAINNKLVAISFYPETRHASRDTSNNLLLLEDFISILLSDRCGVGGEFIS